jgi:putative mRNA 3-end processing factor
MIMKAWFRRGFHVITGGKHLLFDPTTVYIKDELKQHPDESPPDLILVSHGHADHCNALSWMEKIPVIMHPATLDVVSLYRDPGKIIPAIAGSRIEVSGIEIEAFEAGHCIGSLQYRVTTTDGSLVYTGDVNNKGSLTNKRAPVITGDYLAIECTLGDPSIKPEYYEVVYAVLESFMKSSLDSRGSAVIYAYPLGAVQEIIYLFNTMEPWKDFNVRIHGTAFKVTRIYEKHSGNSLGRYVELKRSTRKELNVVLAGLSSARYKEEINERLAIKKPPFMMVSGKNTNGKIPHVNLSLHSTYKEINEYIKKCSPVLVLPFHGKHAKFTADAIKRGIKAIDVHENVFEN